MYNVKKLKILAGERRVHFWFGIKHKVYFVLKVTNDIW